MQLQVVLREDVESLGLRGEVVNVTRGYARNYLLPRGLAQVATPAIVKELERRDAQRARHEAQTVGEAQEIATRLEAAELRFDVKAGPTGSLFGSVTATNVADRLWEDLKIRIDRRKLDVGTIKRIGRYTIRVDVFGDVQTELHLLVVPEGGELPPEEELEAAAAAEEAAAAEAEAAASDVPPEPEAAVEPEAEAESEPAEPVAEAEVESEPAEPVSEAEVEVESEAEAQAPEEAAAPAAEAELPAGDAEEPAE